MPPTDLNRSNPAAPSGKTNVVFQLAPRVAGEAPEVSAYVDSVIEDQLDLSDVSTANATTSAHGLCPKLPGDDTKFLSGDGTFKTPTSGGGGGGSLLESAFVGVSSSDLTQDNFGADTHLDNLSIGGFTGVRLHELGPGSDTNRVRLAGMTVPTATSKWRVSCRLRRHTPLTNYEGLGLAVKDNGGAYQFYGWTYIHTPFSRIRFSSGTSYSADADADPNSFFKDDGNLGTQWNVPRDLWMRLEDDATNLNFYVSLDGDYWVKIYSEGRTAFLSGTLTLAGICINPNNQRSGSIETVLDCFSFEIENF